MNDRANNVAALFAGSRLTLARQLAGLRKSELAAHIGKSPAAVSAWELGIKRPSASTVAQLALSLSVDPGFFAVRRDDVALLSSLPHFRSLRSTSQIARDQAFAYGQIAVDIATTIERHVEFPESDLPRFPVEFEASDSDAPEKAARFVRERWDLGFGPIGHLIRLMESHGVLVVFSPPQTASVDAYSFDSQLRPVVVLNPSKRDYYRQRFDLAHELGHLVMHSDAEPGGQIVEEQANRFASEFLMPADEILELLPISMGGNVWMVLGRLKEQWGVSIQALLFRARRLGRLGDVSYRNAMTSISARGWRRDEPGQVNIIEQPSLLPKAVHLLAEEGISEELLVSQCRVPFDLYRKVTQRSPDGSVPIKQILVPSGEQGLHVLSLLSSRNPVTG